MNEEEENEIDEINVGNDIISNVFEDVLDAFLEEYLNRSRFNVSLTGIVTGFTSRTPSFTGFINNYDSDTYNSDLDIYDTIYNYTYSRNRYNFYYDYLMNTDDEMNQVLQQSLNEQPTLEKTDHIINIPFQEYKNVKNNDNKNCCICLVDFEDDSKISILPKCNHIFHNDCIIEWGKYKTSCPVCRNTCIEEEEKKE